LALGLFLSRGLSVRRRPSSLDLGLLAVLFAVLFGPSSQRIIDKGPASKGALFFGSPAFVLDPALCAAPLVAAGRALWR